MLQVGLMTLCGGEYAEDITEHLRTELAHVKGFEVCSADTLLRMQKELATKKEIIISKTGVEHDFNINMKMNKLLVKLLVQTGQLSPKNEGYIFDFEMTGLEVVEFYNDRGDSERLFDEMNNDFLWKIMPFSFLHENTVFLVMMAICRNLYHFLTDFISKKLDFIKPTFRLKKFIFRFMVVPSKWITQGRQQILKLFSTKKYHLLLE